MILYLGLVQARHVGLNTLTLRVHFLKSLPSNLTESTLKAPLKPFELTPLLTATLRQALVETMSRTYQRKLLAFINKSRYITVKRHSLHQIGMKETDLTSILLAKPPEGFTRLQQVNALVRTTIQTYFANTVITQFKTNKNTITRYLTDAETA